MGFSASQRAREKPRLQLVALVARANSDRLPDSSVADAGILHVSSAAEVKALDKLCHSESIPWGAWLKDAGGQAIDKALKTSCDFVIFSPAYTPVTAFKENKLGRIIEVDQSYTDGLLRTVADLPVDAVLFSGDAAGALTWRHIMQFQRLVGLVGKPLLVSVPSQTSIEELQELWDTGVSGVVIALESEDDRQRMSALRKEIDKLSAPPSRKRAGRIAMLPHISAEAEEPIEEEEEEEE